MVSDRNDGTPPIAATVGRKPTVYRTTPAVTRCPAVMFTVVMTPEAELIPTGDSSHSAEVLRLKLAPTVPFATSTSAYEASEETCGGGTNTTEMAHPTRPPANKTATPAITKRA